jgi:hypothetical protein
MLEVLCQLYRLPIEVRETEMGRRQYSQADGELGRYGPARELIDRLEAMYDADAPAQEQQEQAAPLSPEVQRFLQDMNIELDKPRE